MASLAGLALAVIMFWPSVAHPASTIPADVWDPTLQAWQMAWSGHILSTDPMQLWNSNSFYPEQYTFAFSDTLLGYFPAGLIGHGPQAALVRYNMIFVLLHGLAFVGAYALVRQLGAGRIAAAVAGVAFGYAPWRWSQAGHMHVMSVGGIALALAMLARGHGFSLRHGWRTERAKPGWALAGWLVAAWQISLGFGIGIPFAYVLGIIVLVAVVTWLRRRRPALGRRLVIFDAVGVVVFGAVAAFMARPYFIVVDQHPYAKRSLTDLDYLSPSLRSFFTAPGTDWLWGDLHEPARQAIQANAETTLLCGFTLYGLAFAGLFMSIWSAAHPAAGWAPGCCSPCGWPGVPTRRAASTSGTCCCTSTAPAGTRSVPRAAWSSGPPCCSAYSPPVRSPHWSNGPRNSPTRPTPAGCGHWSGWPC